MMIDRERLNADLLTALVPVVVISAVVGGARATNAPWVGTTTEASQWYGLLVAAAAGPQLAQAFVGQLLLARVDLPSWARGLVMVVVWSFSYVLVTFAAAGVWGVVTAYLGLVVVLPLLIVTRLTARAWVNAGLPAVRSEGRHRPGAAGRRAAR